MRYHEIPYFFRLKFAKYQNLASNADSTRVLVRNLVLEYFLKKGKNDLCLNKKPKKAALIILKYFL